MKSEPDVFSVEDLRRKQISGWDGVRNYQARKNLRAMKKGDLAFFYHSSVNPPSLAGMMEIVREAYPDATSAEGRWDQVDVKHLKTFGRPVSVEEIKRVSSLRDMVLLKNTRLSVQPVTAAQWEILLRLADA